MSYCSDLEIITNEKTPKAFAEGVVVDYGICKFKQKILADCISRYEIH